MLRFLFGDLLHLGTSREIPFGSTDLNPLSQLLSFDGQTAHQVKHIILEVFAYERSMNQRPSAIRFSLPRRFHTSQTLGRSNSTCDQSSA